MSSINYKIWGGALSAAFLLTASTVSCAHASPAAVAKIGRHAGLAMSGLEVARDSGQQTGRIAMRPQTSLKLLNQATKIGAHPSASTIKLTISLKLRHMSQLKTFLQEVQDPHSPLYHDFLTPTEFAKRYGPTQAQVEAVVEFARNHGIQVLDVSRNRLLVRTRATTQAYERALGIHINDYHLNGRSFFSTEDAPKLPQSVAGITQNVIGLDNAVVLHSHHHIRPLETTGTRAVVTSHAPPPATSAYYNPMQIATAYDWPSVTDSANGRGITTAILTADSSDLSASDYTSFWNDFSLPNHKVNVYSVDPGAPATDGTVETLLDMEWSGAMAPGETLDVYVAGDPSLATFTDLFNHFVDDNSAQVMTTSWGAPESAWSSITPTTEAIFMQGAAQGISMFAAAGDNGSGDGTGQGNMSDYPSSSVYITAANGTELQADINGNYIGESAWSGTGGAISQLFSEPAWQTGAGVPNNGWRNNSDMALNAGSAWPYLLRYSSSWYLVWGTSAVAPMFAGLFAIGVQENGRIGQSNKVIYDDVNAGNYSSDFRDVTTGGNGTYTAGTDWDHPTGWGSPRAKPLLSHLGIQGPHGTLTGSVTEAGSGNPIPGALVLATVGHYFRNTDDSGAYSLVIPAGNYTVTASDFYHKSQTVSVTIGDGQSTTQDFSLTKAPMGTVSGTVKDGNVHGYGLYAEIRITSPDISGSVADIWTDPATGSYSVQLPQGHQYDMKVTPAFDGYQSDSASFALSGNVTKNFALVLSSTCSAPGYQFVQGFGEDFNGTFPPSGWSVETSVNNSFTAWSLNTGYGDGNYTGGTGTAAEASSNKVGTTAYDTSLLSPQIAVSSLPADPVLRFALNFQQAGSSNALDLDISTNGGNTWKTVQQWTGDHGAIYALPGEQERVDLGPYIPASGNIVLRWRYYDTASSAWDWYAQVDDVRIGHCEAVPGGLVIGTVNDGSTGSGMSGARVTDDQGNRVNTIDNSDSNLPAGSYILFTPSGNRSLTASRGYYQSASADVAMTNNAVLQQDFTLNAGRLSVQPGSLDVHVTADGSSTATLTLANDGSAPLHYRIHDAAQPSTQGSSALAWVGEPAAYAEPHTNGDTRITAAACEEGGIDCTVPRHSYTNAGAPATAAGSIVSMFDTELLGTYSLGFNRDADNLWVGSISASNSGGDDSDHEFVPNGSPTGSVMDVAKISPDRFEADMAYNDNTGTLWQIGVSANTFCINELDPATLKVTGIRICPDTGIYQAGLAYDPTTGNWFTGDYATQHIYHIDPKGNVLDSASVGVNVIGLAYNSATGHLFALASGGQHDVYVLDANNGYQVLKSFDVQGLNGNAGAGLDYDCDGHLWITDYSDNRVYEVQSGENGWCAFKDIPWLSSSPVSGTIAAGAKAQVILTLDGSGQAPGTVTKSQFVVQNDSPYDDGATAVPLTVNWGKAARQQADLLLSGPGQVLVAKGASATLSYQLQNNGPDTASGVTLTAVVPVLLTVQSASTSQGSCSVSGGSLSCPVGDVAAGDSVTVAISVSGASAGSSSFTVEAAATTSDPNPANDSVGVTATVSSGSGGSSGGGGLALPALMLLLGLALISTGCWKHVGRWKIREPG